MGVRGRSAAATVLLAAIIALAAADGGAAERGAGLFFRIGTGGIEGTYFPIGTLIAEGLTEPQSGKDCNGADPCGVPGLVAVAQTSNGSVANVRSVAAGELEAALVQADVATWAYQGKEIFRDEQRLSSLRAVASLYAESLHIVVRRNLGVRSVADLRGKRISLDEPGSGTLVESRVVLAAFGLAEADVHPEYVKPALASARMLAGQLDGFMVVAGHPADSVVQLVERMAVDLVPIEPRMAEAIRAGNPFFRAGAIPAGAYRGIGEVPTLDVMAQLLVDAALDEDKAYAVTRALWGERMQRLLRQGHPKGRQIVLARALDGLSIPLHPGAARYYREIGMRPAAGDGARN